MRLASLSVLVVAGSICAGCSESTMIRTSPPNAQVTVNDKVVGLSPVAFTYPSHSMGGATFKYKIEHDGYLPAEGTLRTRVSAGRIVAAVFTTCITCIFRGFKTFGSDVTDIELTPASVPAGEAIGRSPADRLRRIQDLYDQGLMTEQEYKRYRSQILHEAAGIPEPQPLGR